MKFFTVLNGNFALKTYTSTGQFASDITDSSSLQLLINKMPDNSQFSCSIGTLPSSGWKSQMPEGYGMLRITRIDLGRVNMEYFPRDGGYHFIGTFSSSNTPNLGYWYKYTGTQVS